MENAALAAEGRSAAERTARRGTYAITTATRDRRTLFQVERLALLFIDALQHYRREGRYLLHACVVRPDHAHRLITPLGITVERAVGLIKGGFSHRLGSKLPCVAKIFSGSPLPTCRGLPDAQAVHRDEPCTGGIGGGAAPVSILVGVPRRQSLSG